MTDAKNHILIRKAAQHKRWDKAVCLAIGEELRRIREAHGWSRLEMAKRLSSGVGDRTLLSYEDGSRHLTALRLIELCEALHVDPSALISRALLRARLLLDTLALEIDLYALALDESNRYPLLAQWAQNALTENPHGTVEVEPVVVRNLALTMGCKQRDVTDYLTGFLKEITPTATS